MKGGFKNKVASNTSIMGSVSVCLSISDITNLGRKVNPKIRALRSGFID